MAIHTPKRQLLVLTDFSAAAYKALEYAQFLFQDSPTHFHLLHLYTPSMVQNRFMASSIATDAIEDLALSASKRGLKTLLAKINSKGTSVHHSFSTQYSFNLIAPAVKEVISEKKYDLIVMGSIGHAGIEAAFMGSQTLKLIKAAVAIPILAVPLKVTFERPTAFAFATDFSRYFAAAELAPLVSLAKDMNASIQIVQVNDSLETPSEAQQFNMRMLHSYLEDLSFEAHRISGIHKIAKSLGDFTETHGIHLLAFLNYQHSFLENLTKEAIAKKLLKIVSSPLLVLPELSMTGNAAIKQTNSKVSDKKNNGQPSPLMS